MSVLVSVAMCWCDRGECAATREREIEREREREREREKASMCPEMM